MELHYLYKLIKKNKGLLLGVVLACLVGNLIYLARQETSYDVSLALTTQYRRQNEEGQGQYYEYDGFYSMRASERFLLVVEGVLKSAGFAKEVYAKAEIPLENMSINALEDIFTPHTLTERMIEVTFSARNQEEAEKLSQSLTDVLSIQAEIASSASNEGDFFITSSSPVILLASSHAILFTIMSLLGGFFLGIFWILVLAYLEEEKE